ncbi:NAD-dependent epimerase/dehydratase family protein [Streptosporangium sp. NBC_01756]|uniref:NAD-dependent epimerase/dehydratase family protein n=1 Tax=Streptosporangium sp. NBC_01756 TaxID=2975950 RepID=UPI002DDA3BDC|nr:NAD-dependent epimerase/dehydratase family protein [Streptosporangium sp. NBC_01756]WSC87611.1 NAD-dependent epimerase/dehydratase family protein [Streptosporangium sp. NBC_01756]
MQQVERAVVTGVAGFIGSHLAEALLLQGANVVGIDRRSPAGDPVAAENLESLLGRRGFHLVEGELGELDLRSLTEGASAVFHLAGVPGVRPSWGERFAEYLASNVMVTQRLLEACVSTDVPRMVLASSSSVYGNSVGRPSREEDLPFPLSPYGVTKLAAERLSLAYAVRRDTPLSVVALRYFTVYGPRQRPDMAIGRILRSVLTGHPLRLYGDGVQRRDFTYVGDAVAATMAACVAPAQAEVVNVGGGRSVSMLDVLACAAQVTGQDVPILRDVTQLGDVDTTEADLTRARKLLGYEPSTSLAEGMGQQWKWITS